MHLCMISYHNFNMISNLNLYALLCRPEPKYEVHVPSHSFVLPERTYHDIARSYSRLYIASDFTHLIANWTQVESQWLKVHV